MLPKKSKQKRIVRELIEFDEVKILLPDDSILLASISEQLLLNQNLPADLLQKMAECGAQYARWGVVRADLQSYLEAITDEFEMFMKEIMSTARKGLTKPTAGIVSEKAILANEVLYLKKRKVIRRTNKAIEKVKRVMKAFEITSDLSRSIGSYLKKEAEISDPEDAVISKKGNLKNF